MQPQDWPSPPLGSYVLESPWLLFAALLAAGAVLIVHARRRANKKLFYGGVTVGAVAVLIFLLSFFVTTDRERMLESTRSLVRGATQPVNVGEFERTLSREVQLFERDYAEVIAMVGRSATRFGVEHAWVTNLAVRQDSPTTGQTYLAVVTRGSGPLGGGTVKTTWLLKWRKEKDGVWRAVLIEWLSLGDGPPSDRDLP